MEENRGKPLTCRLCGHRFKFPANKRLSWENNRLACPVCKKPYCILPKTERKLRVLQDLYFLNNRNKYYIDKISSILYSYCKSIILKNFSKDINSEKELQYYVENSVHFFVEEYLKKENFKISVSFAGLLKYKIRQALYGKKEHTSEDISLDYDLQDGHKALYEDKKSILQERERDENKLSIWEHINKLILNMSEYCTPLEYYVLLINLKSFFVKGKHYNNKFFKPKDKGGFGRIGKDKFLTFLDMLKEELKENENPLEETHISNEIVEDDIILIPKKDNRTPMEIKLEIQTTWLLWKDREKYKSKNEMKREFFKLIDYKNLDSSNKKFAGDLIDTKFDKELSAFVVKKP